MLNQCIKISIIILFLFINILTAGEWENQRIWLSLDLFPGMLASDKNINEKTDLDGNLVLVLLYVNKKDMAEDMAAHLRKIKKIRKIPLKIEISDDLSMKKYENKKIAGIFFSQRIKNVEAIVEYGKKYHVIVFSPFEKDMEREIFGGIAIYDQILPYINKKALKSYDIHIKDFYLQIAEIYE